MKTLKRIPNRRDQDYFNLYDNPQFQQIVWYQQVFNFISRCLYFMTGPKFVVPILGNVQEKVQLLKLWISAKPDVRILVHTV